MVVEPTFSSPFHIERAAIYRIGCTSGTASNNAQACGLQQILGMNILLLLFVFLAGNHTSLRTTDFVFGNCDKSDYTWFNPWGGFVANVRDTHDTDTQWSRWTLSEDGRTATRSIYRIL